MIKKSAGVGRGASHWRHLPQQTFASCGGSEFYIKYINKSNSLWYFGNKKWTLNVLTELDENQDGDKLMEEREIKNSSGNSVPVTCFHLLINNIFH